MTDQEWQERCTSALLDAVKGGGHQGLTLWLSLRDEALRLKRRITIADGDFTSVGLQGFDLSRCYIIRCNFNGANLTGTFFNQAIFRLSSANNTNIEGANFKSADISGLTLHDAQFDKHTNLDISDNASLKYVSSKLRRRVSVVKRTKRFEVVDSQSWLVRVMLWITDYGYSLNRISLVAALIILLYAILYVFANECSMLIGIIFSVQSFVGNGGECLSLSCQILQSTESLIGIIVFALVTAIMFFVVTEQK